jgi:hypothetical protein
VREVLTRRNEDAAATIQRMQADCDELVAKVEGKRQKNKDKKAALLELREQSRAKDAEMEREIKKKERLDRELKVGANPGGRSSRGPCARSRVLSAGA